MWSAVRPAVLQQANLLPNPDIVKFDVSMIRSSVFVILLVAAGLAGGCTNDDSPSAAPAVAAESGKKREAEKGAGRSAGGGQKQSVEVTPITRRDLSETLRVVGSLAPNETATIRPEM